MLEVKSVFVINLVERPDRLTHMKNEFKDKSEFKVEFIRSRRNKVGALGLWKNIVKIITKAQKSDKEYVIICEDDHQFTKEYSAKKLDNYILEGKRKNADVLLAGVSWFKDAVQISANLFWIDKFSGLQFTVIYRKFFDLILAADFGAKDAADYKISELAQDIFLIFPYLSTQKEFGYSDATPKNNSSGRVAGIFDNSAERLECLDRVRSFYALNNSQSG